MSRLLHHLIESAAQAAPDAEAVSYRGTTLSYTALQQSLTTVAAGLQELGLQSGERVAVFLPKQLETVQAIFAAAMAGGIFVPVNPLLKAQQVAHILSDCEASILITSKDRAKLLAEVLPRCQGLKHIVLVDGDAIPALSIKTIDIIPWQQLLAASTPTAPAISEASIAAILYTSGSTGRPKGVVLSHKNLMVGAESVSQYLGTTTSDRILAVLPLSFDYGLNQLTKAFHAQASVTLMNYLLPQEVLKAVSQGQITTLAGVPSLWMQLAPLAWPKEAVDSLRTITNSGGHLPGPVVAALQSKLTKTRIFLMYGLTEAFRSTYLPPEEIAKRPSSMGKAIPNAEVMVVREDGTPCEPGEPGELVHAGPLVTQGYWNNPEKTQRHFRPPPAAMADRAPEERVVWSGDTVTMDEEGYLYFVGREDEMIKTSGYRVSPGEVEEVIHATQLVGEVAVFGVPHPTRGQAIVAVISPADGPQPGLVEAVLLACKKQLPSFMVPLHIELKAQLPKNPNGKIDRTSLKQELQGLFNNAT
jgi:acyl-CoA ligase (AMP-forming) (exosortase A-associated)